MRLNKLKQSLLKAYKSYMHSNKNRRNVSKCERKYYNTGWKWSVSFYGVRNIIEKLGFLVNSLFWFFETFWPMYLIVVCYFRFVKDNTIGIAISSKVERLTVLISRQIRAPSSKSFPQDKINEYCIISDSIKRYNQSWQTLHIWERFML